MDILLVAKLALAITAGVCALVPFSHSWWNHIRARRIARLPQSMVSSRAEAAWEWNQWKATMTAASIIIGVVLNFFP
jgi:hypothetical protein